MLALVTNENSIRADFLTPTSILNYSSEYSGRNASDAIQSGDLSSNDINGTHNETNVNNMWLSNGSIVNQYIIFELPDIYDLSKIYLWNYYESASLKTRSINSFHVTISSDNIVWTNPSSGNSQVAAIATLDAGSNIIMETLNMSSSNTHYIRFDIDTNHGDANYLGIAEVRFEGTKSPDNISPTISVLSPLNNDRGVPVFSDLKITFNDNIQFGTGNVLIKKNKRCQYCRNI
jgi:hypothetical protein